MTPSARVFNFGAGRQSTAVLVLAAQRKIYFDAFVFCNVGEDSENPATLRYVEEYVKPYVKEFDIPFFEICKTKRDGSIETVYGRMIGQNRSVCVPARMSNGAPGNRTCTVDFKIRVSDKWCKQQGYTHVVKGLGISRDELYRLRSTEWEYEKDSRLWVKREYPLFDLGYSLHDCIAIIKEAGLPIPPKSSCWFCPFKSQSEWIRMRQDEPEMFQKAVDAELFINQKRNAIGKDVVYFHRSLKPLDQAIGDQLSFEFLDDNCETGYCMT